MTFKNRSNQHIKKRLAQISSDYVMPTDDNTPLVESLFHQNEWCKSLKKKIAEQKELGKILRSFYAEYTDMHDNFWRDNNFPVLF